MRPRWHLSLVSVFSAFSSPSVMNKSFCSLSSCNLSDISCVGVQVIFCTQCILIYFRFPQEACQKRDTMADWIWIWSLRWIFIDHCRKNAFHGWEMKWASLLDFRPSPLWYSGIYHDVLKGETSKVNYCNLLKKISCFSGLEIFHYRAD